MLQERAYRRASESIQDHIQRLKHLIAPHKGESEAWFNTRLAARWQQSNETPYEFGARMKAHHARVCIDNGPSSDEDGEWERMKMEARDLAEKLPVTLERIRKGKYPWLLSDARCQLWHFDDIDARKTLLADRKKLYERITC